MNKKRALFLLILAFILIFGAENIANTLIRILEQDIFEEEIRKEPTTTETFEGNETYEDTDILEENETQTIAITKTSSELVTPDKEPPYIKFYKKLDNTTITVNNDKLIVEHYDRWLPYLWISINNNTIHLPPYPLYEYNTTAVPATYVYINSTYSRAEYPLNEIIKQIKVFYKDGANIELNIDVESKLCYIELIENDTLGFTTCDNAIYLPSISFYGDSMYDVIVYDVNTTVIEFLQNQLINELGATSYYDLVWKLLEWIDENTEYEYIYAIYDVKTPIEFYYERIGICADYAVFTASALLAGGFNETYILEFNTIEEAHATAGVEINGVLYILDQRLPVYEWNDYVEYVFKPEGTVMQILKISLDEHGSSVIEIRPINPNQLMIMNKYPDTYPSDTIPEQLVHDAMTILSNKLGFTYTSSCLYNQYYRWELLDWEVLKAYTPLFHRQFASLLASTIEKYLYSDLSKARCVWSTIKDNTLYIYIG
ncbi:MAG: hypothetical protein J7L82_03540 [Staphylothermus sp.]|nr:hypothetical protein [Staphylothermus sp.]